MQGVFGITQAKEAVDFTPYGAFLHGHHEQNQIVEGKPTVTGKVATGAEDKAVQVLLHCVDGTKESAVDHGRGQLNAHKRRLLESEFAIHFQGRICFQ